MHAPLPTGKTITVPYAGQTITLFNQRCTEWKEPYGYLDHAATLSQAGCGIFSLCHALQILRPDLPVPDAAELAAFSLAHGCRGDDGTDRPALLSALMRTGLHAQLGFTYAHDGLRNDLDALYTHLSEGRGAALCNLRIGHIVALAAAREENGKRLVLALDPYSESDHARFSADIASCIPDSAILTRTPDAQTVLHHAMFWVPLCYAMDFNLLYRL